MKWWAIFLVLAVALGQAPLKSVIGEVTSIDAAANEIKIKTDAGAALTVSVNETTSFLRIPPGETDVKKGVKIAFSNVAVGDRMLARVPSGDAPGAARNVIIMTKAELAQKHDRDRAEWQKRGIAGTVTAVNAAGNEITINTHVRDAAPVVVDVAAAQFRRYPPASVRFADAKPSSLAEVKEGDTLQALGDKNADGTHFKAEELITGSFQTIAATVISVDEAGGEVKITDLSTKKPLSIRTTTNTMLRKLEERTATMLARRMRPDLAPAGGGRFPGGGGRFPGAGGEAGAPGGPGGGRGPGRGSMGADLRQILDRSPQLNLSELKKGDALIISSSRMLDGSAPVAFSLIAGVEPFLAAAPRTAGQVDLGSWNLSVGAPEQ